MPFWYKVPIPPLPGAEPQAPVILAEWLRPAGSWVEAGDPIARVRCGPAQYEITVNGAGVLAEHRQPVGMELDDDEPLAIMRADGESIPYDKYSLARAT